MGYSTNCCDAAGHDHENAKNGVKPDKCIAIKGLVQQLGAVAPRENLS
jgi:hypothetical protein